MDNLEFEKAFRKIGFASQRRYPNEQLIQFLAQHYFSVPKMKRKNCKILEIGCGSGANLWMMAQEGFDVYGLDIAPSALPFCRRMLKNFGTRATLAVGNMRALQYRDQQFDAIVDVFTIEHTTLKGHAEAFAEVFRCLKSGGRFFSWHLGSKSANFIGGGGTKLDRYTIDNAPNKNVPYANNGLTCFLTAPLARRMLENAGFADISVERTLRSYKNMTQAVEYFAISARKP